jgi:hypothetical protein
MELTAWELIKNIQENKYKDGDEFIDSFGFKVIIKTIAGHQSLVYESGNEVTITQMIRREYDEIKKPSIEVQAYALTLEYSEWQNKVIGLFEKALEKAKSDPKLGCHIIYIEQRLEKFRNGLQVTDLEECWAEYFLKDNK